MSKAKSSPGKRTTKSSTGAKSSRSAAIKDLAPTGRSQSSAKGGKRTVIRDANDKYA